GAATPHVDLRLSVAFLYPTPTRDGAAGPEASAPLPSAIPSDGPPPLGPGAAPAGKHARLATRNLRGARARRPGARKRAAPAGQPRGGGEVPLPGDGPEQPAGARSDYGLASIRFASSALNSGW